MAGKFSKVQTVVGVELGKMAEALEDLQSRLTEVVSGVCPERSRHVTRSAIVRYALDLLLTQAADGTDLKCIAGGVLRNSSERLVHRLVPKRSKS